MRINVENLKELIRKSTVNFSIETVQLRFGGGKVKTNMISSDGNTIAILDAPNDVIDVNDELDFNFSDPSQGVIPFVNLFDNEMVNVKIYENRMTLMDGQQRSNIGFCSPLVVSLLGTNNIKEDVDWFFNMDVDENFKEIFKKIRKIGARFGKVYFEVKDQIMYIDTSDKTNVYSNGLKFELDNCEKENLTLSFDYKNMVNLMNVIGDRENFKLKLTYKEEQELGMLYTKLTDDSEKYCLLSKEL